MKKKMPDKATTPEVRKQLRLKPVIWMGDSRKKLIGFPEDVKDEFGQGLFEAQTGKMPDMAKPFKGVGTGVFELRDNYDTDTYRCVFAVKLIKGVYVLHSFKKKSKCGISTPREDVDKIRHRYDEAVKLDEE